MYHSRDNRIGVSSFSEFTLPEITMTGCVVIGCDKKRYTTSYGPRSFGVLVHQNASPPMFPCASN